MAIYCPSCGRAIPNDSKICPYCTKPVPSHGVISAPEFEKKKETNIALIIVIILAVLIVLTVAIAAIVYVYVSGMIGPPSSSSSENASVTVQTQNGLIVVTLINAGDNYFGGYYDYSILINGGNVGDLYNVGSWSVGESISIGSDGSMGYVVNGTVLDPGDYDVTVVIKDTVVYFGTATIS